MKKAGHSLRLVTEAIQGRPPDEGDWLAVLDIANRGWLGPALYVALRRAERLDEIPPPVRDYLSFLHDRNCERNRRLRAQLLEAIRLMNAAAIEPILLKGAIHLFAVDDEELGSRMMSDLDICIAPAEMTRAMLALASMGYTSSVDHEMERPDDVGIIEFHDQPSGRSAPYLSDDLGACSRRAERDGVVARIPSATARALHLIVHDMIKEGDYWSFRIDVRHLHDLATLARSGGGLDWQQLCASLPVGAARQALMVQARALEDLFGVQIPPSMRPSRRADLRHMARMLCTSRGRSASVVRLIGNLSLGVQRFREGSEWLGGWKFTQQVYNRLAGRSAGPRI